MCPKGFEPPTHGLEGRCSIQLRPLDPKSSALAKLSHTPAFMPYCLSFLFLCFLISRSDMMYYISCLPFCQHFFETFFDFFQNTCFSFKIKAFRHLFYMVLQIFFKFFQKRSRKLFWKNFISPLSSSFIMA